jgi:uncharacterized protein
MKVLLFADGHGSKVAWKKVEKKAKKAGLLLCLGDFTVFGRDQKKILKQIDNLGVLCLLLHGNHESASEVSRDCKKLKNIIFVHKKILRIGHLIFMGYGGGGFSLRDKDFEKKFVPRFVEGIKKYNEKIKESGKEPKTVLLLHGPPYGSKLDDLGDHHCGNKSFREFYVKKKLDYVFCGHIHEAFGVVEHIKGTTLINPGPEGILLDL